MSFQRYQDPAADAALGTTADAPYTGTGNATLISLLKGLFLKPTSALTGIADGSNVTQGTTTDAAYTSGSGSVVSLLKGIFNRLASPLAVLSTDSTQAGSITTATPGVGNSVAVSGLGYGSWAVNIAGTWTGTLLFEGTIDGTNWFAINGQAIGNLANVATASVTANGRWRGVASDLVQVRVRASAWTSGTAVITFDLSVNPAVVSMATALPAGTNTIGGVVQQASGSASGTLQAAATATGFGTSLAVLGYSSVVWTVSGAFVGTVTFQGTEDGVNWSNITVTPLGATTQGSTATAPGLFGATIAGLQAVRATITTYTSGAITVTAHAVPLAGASGNGSGSGGAVTIADGANVTQGSTNDAAYTSGAGSVVGLLKGIFARLRGGQATMANSLPVTLASDQGALTVSGGVNATLLAGENHLGAIGGNTAIVAASLTRPANTTAYAAGQSLANSTSAATALVFANCARLSGGTGLIVAASLLDESNQATKGSFELWLFSGTSAPTVQNDGAVFAPANSDAVNLVAVIPFTVGYIGNTAATSSGNVFFMGDVVNRPFKCGVGQTSLWGALVVRNAYAPISGEVFVPTLTIVQD